MQCEINKVERRRPKALYYINVDLFDDGKYKYLGTLNLLVNTTNEFKIRSMASTPALPPDTEPLLPQIVAPPPFISRPPTNQPARVFKAVEAISNDPAHVAWRCHLPPAPASTTGAAGVHPHSELNDTELNDTELH